MFLRCLFLFTTCLAFAADEPGQTLNTRMGLTWGKGGHDAEFGIDRVSCHGLPKVSGDSPSCDPRVGDTSCSKARPVLCLKPEGLPRPPYAVSPAGSSTTMSGEYYAGWSEGHIGLTAPVAGYELTGREAADKLCETTLGPGYRMAEHHDGRNIEGMGSDRYYGKTWPANLPGGGWAWYAYGNIPGDSRFWVYIDDQPGNCWDKAMKNTIEPVPQTGEDLMSMKGVRITVSSVSDGRRPDEAAWLSARAIIQWVRVEFPKRVAVGSVRIEVLDSKTAPVREWGLEMETEDGLGERRWTKLPAERLGGSPCFFHLPQMERGVVALRVVFPGSPAIEIKDLEIRGDSGIAAGDDQPEAIFSSPPIKGKTP